jgi:hypothetical protein
MSSLVSDHVSKKKTATDAQRQEVLKNRGGPLKKPGGGSISDRRGPIQRRNRIQETD